MEARDDKNEFGGVSGSHPANRKPKKNRIDRKLQWEVSKLLDANRAEYGELTLGQATDRIRVTLGTGLTGITTHNVRGIAETIGLAFAIKKMGGQPGVDTRAARLKEMIAAEVEPLRREIDSQLAANVETLTAVGSVRSELTALEVRLTAMLDGKLYAATKRLDANRVEIDGLKANRNADAAKIAELMNSVDILKAGRLQALAAGREMDRRNGGR